MNWLLLVLSLPTENATSRMRAWRGLKTAGAVVLRDGVYLMPAGMTRRMALTNIADDVETSGGAAYLLELSEAAYPFARLFDRTDEYSKIAADAELLASQFDPAQAAEHVRQLRKLRRSFDAVAAIDFFPGEAGRQTGALLSRLEDRIKAALSSDEPSAHSGQIARLAIGDFQGRLWATRRRPWVDRLASAWLIRRHIDHGARFLWLESPHERPADALGFDFDGAAFTHIEERVTFETLLASFGLEADPGLARLARVIHYLDVGGLPAPEAAGLEALLSGMRTTIADDSELLAAASGAFDFLYASFKENP